MKPPRLRTVEKYTPPYPLNKFPEGFAVNLGRELIYHLASRSCRLEGQDWEEIFARLIGATWKPSNVGLDDVVLQQCAWGTKTVKSNKPSQAGSVRLISGRNSPNFSYGVSDPRSVAPDELGAMILGIWNDRVAGVKKNYQHLRTVVLVKSDDLLETAVFEIPTLMCQPDAYKWQWNSRDNLEGEEGSSGRHIFTWQPHGAQFTIIENVPPDRLAIRIKQPPPLDQKAYLEAINFNSSWVQII
jgi:hypothetical protein